MLIFIRFFYLGGRGGGPKGGCGGGPTGYQGGGP